MLLCSFEVVGGCGRSVGIYRAECFLPQPLAAGGGDVVVYAASVDGCLDFSFTALWGRQKGDFGVNIPVV